MENQEIKPITTEELKLIPLKDIILSKITINPDIATTIAGTVFGGGILAQVDWAKLFSGDISEIGKVVAAGAAWVLGFFTNKSKKSAKVPVKI